jgi:hypothetical protein
MNTWDYYNYTLSVYDIVNNITYIWGYFQFSGDTIVHTNAIINSWDVFVGVWFQTETQTGSINSWAQVEVGPVEKFRSEINKFNACKEDIWETSTLEIPVRQYKAAIEMPELEKSYVRKLVSAFSIVLFDRIDDAWLNETEITDLTQEFNNFLVILKLVKDDDNQCEQNLSNYYMSKFRKSLIEYNLITE